MHFAISAFIVGTFIRTSLGGTLQVIDEDRDCKIYSSDVHGCTGYSAPFAKLDGEDCSNFTVAVNGTRLDFSYVDVAACGQVDGKNAAWIRVNETGEVSFSNQGGDNAKCKLERGLNTGSSCSASDFKSLTSTTASTTAGTTGTTAGTNTRPSSSLDNGSATSTCACT
ncbi:unnamed protein product [Penicillium pancosmium]